MKKLSVFISLIFLSVSISYSKPWVVGSDVNAMNTTGNTRTQSLGTNSDFRYDWERYALSSQVKTYTARDNQRNTAENYLLGSKVEWNFIRPNYLFKSLVWDKDRFSGIDNRTTVGLGYGRYVYESKRQSLIGEFGYQQIWEDRSRTDAESFGSLRFYGKYWLDITYLIRLSHGLEYLKEFENTSSFRVNSISDIAFRLSRYIALKSSYEIKFDNDPAPGFRKTDTIFMIGVSARI